MFQPHTALCLLALIAACGSGPASEDMVDAASSEGADANRADADPDCTSSTYYSDADGDGFGTTDLIAVDCTQPEGFVENDLDCDDLDGKVHPDASELCDGLDNDCDVATEEVCTNGCSVQPNGDTIYLFCETKISHPAAQSYCEGQDMHLVRVDTLAEQTVLEGKRNLFAGNPNIWIGASDTATEGTWLWQDGVQFWQGGSGGTSVGGLFQYWRNGQPDNSGNQDCGAMRGESSVGRWIDRGCADLFPYICERDPL